MMHQHVHLDVAMSTATNNFLMALEAPVTHSEPSYDGYVDTFDEVILHASEGDTLRAINVYNTDLFTVGKEYPVIMGEMMFSTGMATFVDEVGLEVPRIEVLPMRKDLHDTFMLIKGESPVEKALRELTTKRDKMIADAEELRNDLKKLDEFDSEWNIPYSQLSDVDKGALHLAAYEGKTIQYATALVIGSGWADCTPLWLDMDEAFYRVKPLSYQIINDLLEEVQAALDLINRDIAELEGESGEVWF